MSASYSTDLHKPLRSCFRVYLFYHVYRRYSLFYSLYVLSKFWYHLVSDQVIQKQREALIYQASRKKIERVMGIEPT